VGIVKKSVDKSALRVFELEKKIKVEFNHIKKVRIINYRGPNIKQEIARIAADEIRSLDIEPDSSIAISCGTTIMELAKNLETDPGGIKSMNIFPLIITMTASMEEASPAGIVSFLIRVFPNSKGYAAQFPKIEKVLNAAINRKNIYSADCSFLLEGLKNPKDNSFLIKGSKNAKYMLTGLGGIGTGGVSYSFNAYLKELGLEGTVKDDLKAVGESCHQPFTIDGRLLMGSKKLELLRANLIYVDLKELKKKVTRREVVDIFAIAGGKEKHESVLGGLRAKIFNNLITDIGTAEYIVENIISTTDISPENGLESKN
jgi:DNA-binding transcriptional regulator LsrR (DeoR family)